MKSNVLCCLFCSQQVHAIISASNSVKNSKKLLKVLEIVLAFGNYMNSGKRGPAYGFRVQSLDTLMETKSSDKRMCLLHYIVETIRLKFPELLNFDSELMYIEKASSGTQHLILIVTYLYHRYEKLDVYSLSRTSYVEKDFISPQ